MPDKDGTLELAQLHAASTGVVLRVQVRVRGGVLYMCILLRRIRGGCPIPGPDSI